MVQSGINQLREQVRGAVITPDDEDYEQARRVYNAMIDRRPAAVVRCANAGDVVAAVNFAREHQLDLAVRGGQHSVPGFGTCDDGVVVDLSGMREVRVDPAAGTARADGGATWGHFNDATHAFGLATTGGIISTTGVAGLSLGGGIGYLARGCGLSCDQPGLGRGRDRRRPGSGGQRGRARRPVLGPPRRWWQLRGGDLLYVPGPPHQGHLRWADVLRAARRRYGPDVLPGLHRRRARGARRVPGLPDRPATAVRPGGPSRRHVPGDGAVLGRASGPGTACPGAVPRAGAGRGRAPRPDALPRPQQRLRCLVPPGLQHYWKANFVTELTDEAIAAHLEHGSKVPVVNSTVHIYPINGACHRVASDATAFAYRDANFATVIAGMWPDPAQNEANINWVRSYYDATAPLSEAGGYINFMADDDQDRIKANYRGNYERLVTTKRKYDPDNLFHLNQNIRP